MTAICGKPVGKSVIRADRIRTISGTFAFIEHRFLRDGFFESLTRNERILYLFLILVSDRHGISWYPYDNICAVSGLIPEEYIEARNGLIANDLISFDGRVFQVLSLPEKPLVRVAKPMLREQQKNPALNTEPVSIGEILKRLLSGASHDR